MKAWHHKWMNEENESLFFLACQAKQAKLSPLVVSCGSVQPDPVYMLKMFPSRWTARWIRPASRSSSFRWRPTCSQCRTSQNTQISARSRWMLALQVGNPARRTERLRRRHAWRDRQTEEDEAHHHQFQKMFPGDNHCRETRTGRIKTGFYFIT